MSEHFNPHGIAGKPARRPLFWWVRGRASRREYWAYIGFIIVLAEALSYLPGAPSGAWAGSVIMIAQIRRLHDFNRTGWWAVLATAVPFAALFLIPSASVEMITLAALVLTLIPLIWIGALKGTPDENRFGPPPSTTWKHMLTGR